MKRAIAGILLAITVLLFTTALALAVIHITNFPYKIDIDLLNISEKTGLPRTEVLSNYSAVLEYLSPFSNKFFSLPTLRYTEKATYHFAECKTMFNTVYLLGLVSGIILVFLAINKAVSRRTLIISGTVTLAIPAVTGAAMLTIFDWTFAFFHSLFFGGSTWLFNPEYDEIIRILPSEFFMHCGILIAIFWFAGAALQLIIGYSKRKACNT